MTIPQMNFGSGELNGSAQIKLYDKNKKLIHMEVKCYTQSCTLYESRTMKNQLSDLVMLVVKGQGHTDLILICETSPCLIHMPCTYKI